MAPVKVPFIPAKRIEEAALGVLGEYGQKFTVVEAPPIPVEAIIESHLRLTFEMGDLEKMLGVPDALGATWVRHRKVVIDQSLDPVEHPTKEGRYRFTVAHEIGHWDLHRILFPDEVNQPSIFDAASKPSIVCRKSGPKEPMETQADMFASYLLMPKQMVFKCWKQRFGSLEPHIAEKEIADLSAKYGLAEDEQPTVEVAKEFSRDFRVSGQAMQIRLVTLGLIAVKTPDPDLFSQQN